MVLYHYFATDKKRNGELISEHTGCLELNKRIENEEEYTEALECIKRAVPGYTSISIISLNRL